jgi:hypothetical protein
MILDNATSHGVSCGQFHDFSRLTVNNLTLQCHQCNVAITPRDNNFIKNALQVNTLRMGFVTI